MNNRAEAPVSGDIEESEDVGKFLTWFPVLMQGNGGTVGNRQREHPNRLAKRTIEAIQVSRQIIHNPR
jgi:hypothetical protein